MRAKKIFIAMFVICVFGITNIFGNNYFNVEPLDDYKAKWVQIDSLISEGLPQSAYVLVNEIYNDSKLNNNTAQFLKAIIYKMSLASDYEEDYVFKSVDTLRKELDNSQGNIKAIIHSMLAQIYWNYYQNNRYQILNRTEVVDYSLSDLKTWDVRKIIREVIRHYLLSLENPEELQKVDLEQFNPILDNCRESRFFRPTLYDFLAHRAIDFFSVSESGLTEPANKFEINNSIYFSPFSSFINYNIISADTFSMNYYAIKIFQDIVRFHSKDSDPRALIDVELKRLKFVKDNYVGEGKDSLYSDALLVLDNQFKTSEFSADIIYQLANHYVALGGTYASNIKETYKWYIKKAQQYCNIAIERFPGSVGANNCSVLKYQIETPVLSVIVEAANIPDKPFRAFVEYKNASDVYFRIIKIDPELNRKLVEKKTDDELIEEYLKNNSLAEWMISLPDDGDMQPHSAEVKVSELPCGFYILLASTDKNFSYQDQVVSWTECWVTRIGFINREKENGSMDFYVVDREIGSPLKNVNVQTYSRNYNYLTRKYEYKKQQNFISNEDGYFEVPPYKTDDYDYNYFYVEFKNGEDIYFNNSNFYQYPDYDNEYDYYEPVSYIFTDRGIYRPGQSIYFKGIVLQPGEDDYKIKPGYKVTVSLYDVNYEVVSTLELVTNEYGTYNGVFTAPSSGLTGQMHINDDYGTAYISVEEYKRPKFEVDFEPVKGTYKLNDTVTVTGFAKAYAGNVVDGAQVKYRVIRESRFPYWGYWCRWSYPNSASVEICNGTTLTDEAGRYSISFKAIPDLTVDEKFKPVFDYTVYADVTDINGETHSSATYISVSNISLLLSTAIPSNIEKNEKNEFRIYTTNFSGQSEHTNIGIKIYKLVEPDRIFRDRKWNKPDKYTMTREEYYSSFPNDLYDEENNSYLWDKDKEVFSKEYFTGKDSVLKADMSKWPSGIYVLEISAIDKYGTPVESKSYFTLFSAKDKKIPVKEMSWFNAMTVSGEPGEKALMLFGTAMDDLRVLYEIEFAGKIIKKEWLKINDEQKLFEIPIIEDYRGNFTVHYTFVKLNQCNQYYQLVYVPFSNKKLDIEFETFRDKLYPGQEEEWRIIIKGHEGEKVAAEMVATLYDASLDAFRGNSWYFNIDDYYWNDLYWDISRAFTTSRSDYVYEQSTGGQTIIVRNYELLNWFGYNLYGYLYYRYSYMKGAGRYDYDFAEDGVSGMQYPAPAMVNREDSKEAEKDASLGISANLTTSVTDQIPVGGGEINGRDGRDNLDVEKSVQVRKNFNETAFFYPCLMTNDKGEIIIKFTIPEALTKWKMMGFAHTKDLKYGSIENELVTQKDLMVVPNSPRFFREGDKIFFSAKISNVSDKDLNGEVDLQFFNALTMESVDAKMNNNSHLKPFSVLKGQSCSINWEVDIPESIGAITYRIIAKAGNFSDGEEQAIPVLTNRLLVTETLPLPINGNQKKDYTLPKLINSGSSSTLRNHKLTLEFTSNPAWYAIQALPYIMEYPYECSEQLFNRYYANSIASFITNSSPRIKQVFDSWKNFTPDALLSNLEKNQELKSLMLEETPWVFEANNETERKQRVALLFDLNRMSDETERALVMLQKRQTSNGGWAWFNGMPDDRYITQYIVTGFGHLDNLGIKDVRENSKVWNMLSKAVYYLDERMKEDYDYIKKYYPDEMNKNHLGYYDIQYLYARSYFKDIEVEKRNREAFDYFAGQADKYWNSFNRYLQGMIALALYRYEYDKTPQKIIKSLKETALHNEEMGMYWRDFYSGYYWYEAPIEEMALLIECFDEVADDTKSVEEMKIWLLKQKQTCDWKTTKATAEACYALLMRGADLLLSTELVKINIGGQDINPLNIDNVKVEAGTGYFKTSWSGSDIIPEMGNVVVTKTDDGVAWGALYWQYFEQLDKITPAKTPLQLDKKLFRQKNTPTGIVLEPVNEQTLLKVGDKLTVRIELRVDRDMEYVHMKDMRASGFEPVNVLSQYKYQDGLGYYESTRDAATNFFFSYLPKGTYVFEYPLFITHSGDFSNGITTVQCMYAPEFTSHSEGIRVKVED